MRHTSDYSGQAKRAAKVIGLLAGLVMTTGCHESQHYWSLTDVHVSLPPITGRERPQTRAGAPSEWLEVRQGGDQTVLIACQLRDDPEKYDDERTRTFVIVLDGPPARGKFDVTPANGRLIEHDAWFPARQPYAGIEGAIEILKVADNGNVLASCKVRKVISFTTDPVRTLRGWYWFKPEDGQDRFCGVRLVEATVE